MDWSKACPETARTEKWPAGPVDSLVIHCTWGQYSYSDTDCGNWQTDCGQDFCFIEGGPKDNLMQFCCYCGKPLREEPYEDEYEDSEEG